jgi:hypothetical protein
VDVRCEACGHLGPPAGVEPAQDGMVLTCANCSHPNVIRFVEQKSTSPKSALAPSGLVEAVEADTPPPREETPPAPGAQERGLEPWLEFGLLPEPGAGVRCQKCVALVRGATHCPRCGLAVGVFSSAGRLAPWGVPVDEQTADQHQWTSSWEMFVEDRDEGALRASVEAATRAHLVDGVIRAFRLHLVEHSEDETVKEELRRIGNTLRAQAVKLQAQGEVELRTDLGRTSRWLLQITWMTAIVAFVVLIWIASFFLFG